MGNGKGAYFPPPHATARCLQEWSASDIPQNHVYKVPAGGHFDLASWTGDGGTAYSLSAENGKIESTQPNHAIY